MNFHHQNAGQFVAETLPTACPLNLMASVSRWRVGNADYYQC